MDDAYERKTIKKKFLKPTFEKLQHELISCPNQLTLHQFQGAIFAPVYGVFSRKIQLCHMR